ncbi:unnamed protein product [Bemisia tabaci]|uniref:Uncharacterized protein n=1 Tax=Bemisia tabaci TaxID=7038 RepID=A0A9P0F1B6_BEMTA|nr:unnamed protein product [Bemisia tabaci]
MMKEGTSKMEAGDPQRGWVGGKRRDGQKRRKLKRRGRGECNDTGCAGVKMEHHFQAALDPRKQELLEARFIGARRVGCVHLAPCHSLQTSLVVLYVTTTQH